jgi:Beta protein
MSNLSVRRSIVRRRRRSAIFPVLELSRGKKIRGAGKNAEGKSLPAEQLLNLPGIYGFEKNYSSAFELMGDCDQFFVDLTREPSLSCYEIEQLGLSLNGYERWTDFVFSAKGDHSGVLPTLIVNPAEEEDETQYVSNLTAQFRTFAEAFDAIAYRASVLEDEGFMYDIAALKPEIETFQSNGGRFYVFLDHEYIRPSNGLVHAKRTSQIIDAILNEIPELEIVVFATSFPKSVTDVGDEEHDIFRVEEMFLFEEISKYHKTVLYGDYGSINPIRNDELIITQGWRPRIDFVSRREGLWVYYFREKRDIIGQEEVVAKGKRKNKNIYAPYSTHYASVARDVVGFSPYYEDLKPSWGNENIVAASGNQVPSNSPSHWISVRMEIHMVQVLKKLSLDAL